MGFWDNLRDQGQQIVDDASGVAEEAAAYRERPLTLRESDQADKVFRGTVPFWKVRLSDGLGFGQRPYTVVSPPGFYCIHIGPRLFDNPLAMSGGEITLVHELTHVWQGVNYFFPLNYIFDSIWHQNQDADAYAYTLGQPWSSYNVEQQAEIVQDWWDPMIGGGSESDARFPYIRDNIRGLQRDSASSQNRHRTPFHPFHKR